jgi:transaldolase
MKIFLDTANLDELKKGAAWGIVDGVTTNPTLIAREGVPLEEQVRRICDIVDGDISAEVVTVNHKEMIEDGRRLAKIHKNIVVKIPLIREGIIAVKALAGEGIRVNVTLCFTAAQALLAAKAGASFISPFVGRLDDVGSDGMVLIRDIVAIYRNYPALKTEVLVASIRHPIHVVEAAKLGAHVSTMPPAVLRQMFAHPLTEKGLAAFLADWAKTGQSILGQAKAAAE